MNWFYKDPNWDGFLDQNKSKFRSNHHFGYLEYGSHRNTGLKALAGW